MTSLPPWSPSSSLYHLPKPHLLSAATTTARAVDPNTTPDSEPSASESNADFDARLSKIRRRYRSGTGKKAELRKIRKSGRKGSGSSAAPGSGILLPPVSLKEPTSDGLKVEFGFSEYSERVNGRIAVLGITALLLVELATGKSVLNYHTPAIVFVQVYFVAAASALYLKYEKEKASISKCDNSSKLTTALALESTTHLSHTPTHHSAKKLCNVRASFGSAVS
ncbi:hypothetical protein Dimus_011401 [Dionaea muscipula]